MLFYSLLAPGMRSKVFCRREARKCIQIVVNSVISEELGWYGDQFLVGEGFNSYKNNVYLQIQYH